MLFMFLNGIEVLANLFVVVFKCQNLRKIFCPRDGESGYLAFYNFQKQLESLILEELVKNGVHHGDLIAPKIINYNLHF